MTINLAEIADLLKPGINAIVGDYPHYQGQWSEIFTKHSSDMASETDVEMRMLGLAQLSAEGASTPWDTMGARIKTNYYHRYVRLGFVITRQALKDNLYKKQFNPSVTALRTSFQQTKEVLAASVLNNGFDTAFPVGDGAALFSTAHVIEGGTQANKAATDADLNETSLMNGLIAIQRFKDFAGLKVAFKGRKLIVPTESMFVAEKLLRSTNTPGSANNDINALRSMSAVPEGYVVNQFLSDTNSWFLKTDAPDGFKHFVREPFETDMQTDFDTWSLKTHGIERYSFGVTNWRAAYGSDGS
jgi:hypothetical protein